MPDLKNRLFWDSPSETFSREAKVRRVFEYGSFADIINYPFNEMQYSINKIQINLLRTSEARKKMLMYLKPYLQNSDSWGAALTAYINDCLYMEKNMISNQ